MPTTTGVATSFIDFTRASNATVTDSDGRVKWAPANLLTNSESFDAAAWTKSGGATVEANSVTAPNGTTTADRLKEATATAAFNTFQNLTAAGNTITFSVFAKTAQRSAIYLRFYNNTNVWEAAVFDLNAGTNPQNASGSATTFTNRTQAITPIGGGWNLCSITATFPSGAVGCLIHISNISSGITFDAFGDYAYAGNSANGVYLWGAHLYRSDLAMQPNTSAYPMYNPTTPKNLMPNSEDFSAAAWAKGGIAAFGSGSVSNAIVAPNGLQTADKIVASNTASAYRYVSPTYTAVTGPCVISVYAKLAEYSLLRVADFSSARFYASFNLSNGTVVAGSTGGAGFVSAGTPVAVGDGWYRCSIVTTLSSSSITFIGYPSGATLDAYGAQYAGDGTSGIYLWGAQLSDSASLDPYVRVYGAAVTSAAYYGPRRDFDPVTLACKGLLVEEQRTNTLLNTSNLTAGSWTATRASVTSGIADPAGGTSAIRLTATSANGDFSQSVSASNITYTNSVYMRRVSGTGNVQLHDPNNGAVVMALTSSWQRFSCSSLPVSGTTAYLLVRIVASGDVIEIAFPQQEAGSFATSYIPTGAATATRNADVASVSTQAFPYSATEGSIVVSATPMVLGGIAYALSDGTASNRIQAQTQASNYHFYIDAGGVLQVNLSPGTLTANTTAKLAGAYKANDFAASDNGSAVATDTSGSVPVCSKLDLGHLNSSGYLNGHIRQITYLPRRLSSSELQTRTA